MEKIIVNKSISVTKTDALAIIANLGFWDRLKNLILNPLRYLITGKIKY